MKRCWSQLPEDRPTFVEITENLKSNGGVKYFEDPKWKYQPLIDLIIKAYTD